METCTIVVPTIASLYYHQVHLISVGRLIHSMIWRLGSQHLQRRQPVRLGRARLGLQVFVCAYVLSFATFCLS